jgi:hypothetical protein
MLDDLQAAGIRFVPSCAWNIFQFPWLADESVHDMLTRPDSKARPLLYRYVDALVARTKSRPGLLFWELGNEWNLAADHALKSGPGGRQMAGAGEPYGLQHDFTSAELISFNRGLAAHVRRMDPAHAVTSGYSRPVPSAWHLRRHPAWPGSSAPSSWQEDNLEQFEALFRDLHRDFDLVSVHLYNKPFAKDPARRQNELFGLKGADNAGLLDIYKREADHLGKPLFLGEFGDEDPSADQDPAAHFSHQVLKKVAGLSIPYSAIWVWEFHQKPDFDVEPGKGNALIQAIQQANQVLEVHP